MAPAMAPAPANIPSSGVKAADRYDNRRKHHRIKTKYKACIRRRGFLDDIVECIDMAKGGLSFKSTQRYEEKSAVDIAVPYEAGTPGIFVSAQIVYVRPLEKEKTFQCGLAYVRDRLN
jgi:hypothetical protein